MSEFKSLHLFAGIGGAALGMQQSVNEYKGAVGRFRTLAGIDCDSLACADFERLTGAPAAVMDLFSRDDYIAFHGTEPPAGWREADADDIFAAAGREYPDMVFLSPPCKGFSGLLPSKSAASEKYQALNRLVVRGLALTVQAFQDSLPGIIMIENVPRIATRGRQLLDDVKRLLGRYGYLFSEGYHDCGEIGSLGQRRKRYLLIARHPEKVNAFVYHPPKLKLRTIGEVIGPMPMPDDKASGPLHRMPRLQWKTWVRLALIPAGGDWRDLQDIDPEQYRIEYVPRGGGPYGVQEWDKPGASVIGRAGVRGSNAAAVSDPRMDLDTRSTHKAIYKVSRWDNTASTVTGAQGPNNGAICIPDPRLKACDGKHPQVYQILKMDETAPCVTGTRFGSGAPAISDPRHFGPAKFNHAFSVTRWDEAAGVVAGGTGPTSGAHCIADPRIGCTPRSGTMGVQAWDEPGKTVIGSGDIHAGATAVADPRIPADTEAGVWVIVAEDGTWHRPLTTLELAALQGFPLTMPDGKPLTLAGTKDSRWREAIGNAVPPPAAKAIGEQILTALMASERGEWTLGSTDIWVKTDRDEVEDGLSDVSPV